MSWSEGRSGASFLCCLVGLLDFFCSLLFLLCDGSLSLCWGGFASTRYLGIRRRPDPCRWFRAVFLWLFHSFLEPDRAPALAGVVMRRISSSSSRASKSFLILVGAGPVFRGGLVFFFWSFVSRFLFLCLTGDISSIGVVVIWFSSLSWSCPSVSICGLFVCVVDIGVLVWFIVMFPLSKWTRSLRAFSLLWHIFSLLWHIIIALRWKFSSAVCKFPTSCVCLACVSAWWSSFVSCLSNLAVSLLSRAFISFLISFLTASVMVATRFSCCFGGVGSLIGTFVEFVVCVAVLVVFSSVFRHCLAVRQVWVGSYRVLAISGLSDTGQV